MIKVFSTYTKDIIHNIIDNSKITQKGGPAFFIDQVFKKKKVDYNLKTNLEIEVEIKVSKKTETGKIKSKIIEKEIKNIKREDTIIISTIGREWILGSRIIDESNIFLDIQGYARTTKINDDLFDMEFWSQIFCIKGTAAEMKKLPLKILRKQKERCLIITKGSKGAEIFYNSKKYIFNPKKQLSVKNTIGAGDVFFANFIISFIKTKGDIQKSGNFAIRETELFLTTK